MTKKQRGWASVAAVLAALLVGAYLAGFYWGFGDEPNVEYGVSGGLMAVALVTVVLAGYGVLGALMFAVFAWVERGK